MADESYIKDLLDDQAVRGAKAKAALIGTAHDIMKRVDMNLRRLEVGDYNRKARRLGPDMRTKGTMRRSIYWQVFNSTGGDEQKLKFWMDAVEKYVELSVQGGGAERGKNGTFIRGTHRKGWKVNNGGLPRQISRQNFEQIQVGRVNANGRTLRRKAKPFISGELRLHGRMLFDRLVRHYAFIGNVIMASAVDVRGIAAYFDRNGRNTRSAFDKYGNANNIRLYTGDGGILEEMKRNIDNDVAAMKGWNPVDGNV